jgi:hypothetical protein
VLFYYQLSQLEQKGTMQHSAMSQYSMERLLQPNAFISTYIDVWAVAPVQNYLLMQILQPVIS